MRPWTAVWVLVGILACAKPMRAHDHVDPNYDWYTSRTDSRGRSCCNGNDWTEPNDWRRVQKGYQIYIKGTWVDVPPEAVLTGPSPTGQSVLWYTMPRNDLDLLIIRCFIPGAEI